ncbi:PilZ domain-containing protein [Methylomarinum sp. Ch1-1]|uniref:PilZ domain-containing protein n=1 Tax=Methylomarinum roseum TaxID=3067653 RepID=A0AAU7NPZ9_9GAMM|nr:PilZ domain-containing protein [Methylomarinum sp. Ch1-1]MDP4521039.1 PilZ domain-containing protein [Methylomarinum sp. Ch1-1]
MATFQDRKEYRKNLTSSGQLAIAGEILDFKSYDVSLKGLMVEVCPGEFLAKLEDFQALLPDNNRVEIYVKELKLSGEAFIVWVRGGQGGKIQLGLEYGDIEHNAQKLWLRRKAYRRTKPFSCLMMLDHSKVETLGLNMSTDGLAVSGDLKGYDIKVGDVVKLKISGQSISKAIAKIIWINESGDDRLTVGLRYLGID